MTQEFKRFILDRKLTLLVTPLLLLASLLALPSSALAATYTVDSCQHPDGAYAGRDGWTPFYRGAYMYYSDNCAGGGGLDASIEPTLEHNYDDVAQWSFASPAGTSLQRISAVRSARAGSDRPYGSPEAFVRADADYIERCAAPYGCTTLNGTVESPLSGQGRIDFGVVCGGGPGGRCPADATYISLKRIQVVLRDNSAPSFSTAPTGSLTSPNTTARVRTVNYSANDVGGGIYRQRLFADGREVAAGVVNENEGRCSRYGGGGGFSSPVPCRTTVSGSLTYDTAGLSDGAHELELQVFDATDENKVVSSWTVEVDNAPPSVGDVSVEGIAREGESLRCGATVNGQSATVAYQWLRANADGSDVKEISRATDAAYTIVAADVGRKLLCRLTATDRGGSTAKTSSLTAGPFAGGGLVVPKDPGPGGPGTGGQGGASTTGTNTGASSSSAATTGASSNGASNGDGARAAAPLPPLPVCTSAAVAMFGTVARLTRSYDHSSFTLSGRLTATSDRGAVGGAVLDVMQVVVRAGTSQRTKIGTVKTAPDGSFRTKVPPGPTRTVQLVDATCGTVGPLMSERVRGALQAKANKRRVRNKQVARFHGRVLGGYVGRGLPLELQVRVGSSWKDVKAVTSNSKGEYRVSYRFLRTYVRYTYRFRVVSRAGSAWPYMAARSRQVKVRVN